MNATQGAGPWTPPTVADVEAVREQLGRADRRGHSVLTVAGLVHGTRVAGECIIDAACLQAAEQIGGSDLGRKQVQIVVEAAVMGEDSGAPHVIAVHSW